MENNNLKIIQNKLNDILKEVGDYVLFEFKNFKSKFVEYKGNHQNLVSFVDKETEKKLSERLLKLISNSSIIGEEETQIKSETKYTWIIDPIDGTTNFVHGIPFFCISVGLMFEKKIILGAVYAPALNELFYSNEEEEFSYLNGEIIKCSPNIDLSKSLIVTGYFMQSKIKQKKFLDVISIFMDKTRGFRRLGSAAIDLCWVAAGRFDAFFEEGLNSWDVAGGSIIVKKAGGIVTDFSGKDNFLFGRQIVASNNIHPHMIEIVNKL